MAKGKEIDLSLIEMTKGFKEQMQDFTSNNTFSSPIKRLSKTQRINKAGKKEIQKTISLESEQIEKIENLMIKFKIRSFMDIMKIITNKGIIELEKIDPLF